METVGIGVYPTVALFVELAAPPAVVSRFCVKLGIETIKLNELSLTGTCI